MLLRGAIIEHAAKAIALELPKEQVARERTELAKTSGVTPTSARAMAAWVRIHAAHALRQTQCDKIKLADLLFLRLYLQDEPNSERIPLIEGFARERGESAPKVTQALTMLEEGLQSQKQRDAKPETVPGVDADRTARPKLAAAAITGAHVNYRFPNKNLWMDRWFDFLSRNVAEEERPDKVVLTLPSKHPRYEVERLLGLGFRARNIIAVEGGDADAIATFMHEARELGVDARPGRLEQIAPLLERKVDVALLDFLGPPCFQYMDIIHCLPMSDHCVVGVNVMDRREQKEVAKIYERAEAEDSAECAQRTLSFLTRERLPGAFEQEHSRLLAEYAQDFSDIKGRVADTRLVSCFGLAGSCRSSYFEQLTRTVPKNECDTLTRTRTMLVKKLPFFTKAEALLLTIELYNRGLVSEKDLGWSRQQLSYFLWTVILNAPQIRKAEKYEYRSQVTERSPRYLSTFAVLDNPAPYLTECQYAMERFLPLLLRSATAFWSSQEVNVFSRISLQRRNRRGEPISRESGCSHKDKIYFKWDGMTECEGQWGKLVDSLNSINGLPVRMRLDLKGDLSGYERIRIEA